MNFKAILNKEIYYNRRRGKIKNKFPFLKYSNKR
nr:MAG TPA: hypothetical protein [Caudoviricetes sp.]